MAMRQVLQPGLVNVRLFLQASHHHAPKILVYIFSSLFNLQLSVYLYESAVRQLRWSVTPVELPVGPENDYAFVTSSYLCTQKTVCRLHLTSRL